MSDTKRKRNAMMEEEKLNDQMQVRREKMQEFIDAGVYPFGQKYNWDHHAQEVKDQAETLEKNETVVSVAGRLMAIRRHGKTAFCVLRDLSGEIQLYFRKDVLGEESYNLFKLLDLGDIVGVGGTVFVTHTGETTIRVESWQLLSKSLRPLPEKFHGLTDKETRYRQRYLDLIVNPEVTDTFVKRSKIIKASVSTSMTATSSKLKRRCSIPLPAVPQPVRSRRITTPSIWISSCALRRNSTSNAFSSAAWNGSLK